MFILSNSLSLIRAPMALLFLQENTQIRLFAVIFAMLSDSIDGYIARRYDATTVFGAIIDPLMDKFFVYFALLMLFLEHKIPFWACCAMLSRDAFLILNASYLKYTKRWTNYRFRSVRFGKLTTAAQFFVLGSLSVGYCFPSVFYLIFVVFGLCAFLEFLQLSRSTPISDT
ncbi:MAG: CDP-alcohol phosphatidyltransferase family protein [Chlamydiota bacterium]